MIVSVMAKPVVAIVGRPNVGKSTFFNRCVESRKAIVHDSPGVTRDRIYNDVEWSGHAFTLIDTGGLQSGTIGELSRQVENQAKLAISESDLIVFMVDGQTGLSGGDEQVASILRKSGKPVVLAVNKIDQPEDRDRKLEFYGLGLGDPVTLSASRGDGGVGDLLDAVVGRFEPRNHSKSAHDADAVQEDAALPDANFSLAVVGKPNVGKSSIVNRLCGTERSVVTPAPGTTRDAIDSVINYKGRSVTLVDTAGIRRRSRVDYGVEAFSVVRSINAIEDADVVALVLDATSPVSDQDQKIAGKIAAAGKGAVIVLNKWDLVENRSSSSMNKCSAEVHSQLRPIASSEIVFVSAASGLRITNILESAARAYAESHKRIATSLLNDTINQAVVLSPPPTGSRGKRLRIYYSTQVTSCPPTFVFFVNDHRLLTDNYKSYLERTLRQAFGFAGATLRLIARNRT